MYPLPVYNGNTRARKMGPPRAFSFAPGGNQASLMFDALQGTIALGRGGVAPSFARATVATITDQDLVVRQVLSGEARFGGFRRVQNLVGASENNTVGSTNNANITAATTTIQFNSANASFWYKDSSVSIVAGTVLRVRASISCTVARNVLIRMFDFGGNAVNANIAVTTSPQVVTLTLTTAGATGVTGFGIENRAAVGATDTSTTGLITFTNIQCENVTGQSNQNPAEYVSVGVLAAPYQGANVDGVQYFPYLNGNTVASNVVTEARGANISSAILGGYLPEPAATDLLTARADARDMTTANWTLGATMTRARTSVGADGVANKATRLTGGAVAATNIITSANAAGVATRTYSVLIKRVTGTGPVRLTQDNFATSTDISSLLNSSTFTLVQYVNAPIGITLGIKIDTNGDAIDADWNQFSAGDLTGLINSRIPDTITTRNADVLTYATTGWLNAAAGTLYAEYFAPSTAGAIAVNASINDGSSNNRITLYRTASITNSSFLVDTGGVNQAGLSNASITGGAVAKEVGIWQVNDFAGYGNNVTMGTDAAGTIPTVNAFNVGHELTGLQLGHYVRKVSYYPTRLVNETAKALTA